MLLEVVAQRLAPLLGRMARQWTATGGTAQQVARIAAVVDAVAHAGMHAGTPQLYLAELARALEPVLPHDHLELLIEDADGARMYRLGEHAGGAVWTDPSLVIGREDLDLATLFQGRETIVVADTYHEARWPRGYFTVEEPAGAELRSAVAARVRGPGGLTGTCWPGASAPTSTPRPMRSWYGEWPA